MRWKRQRSWRKASCRGSKNLEPCWITGDSEVILRRYFTSSAKSESLRPQTILPMHQTPRPLQMRSIMRPPADSKENRPPHSRQPWFQTPCRAVREASSRRPPNPPALPRCRCTDRPAQKFPPTATTNVSQCKAAAPSLPPIRIPLPTLFCGAAHGRSAIRSHMPTRHKKHCAAYTKLLPCSPPVPFHIPRRAFSSHTESAVYAKNLPHRKFPPPAKIAGIPPAARVIPAKKILVLSLRLAVRAPAARSTQPRLVLAAASTEKPSGTNDRSPAESTTPSMAPGSPRACPSSVPGQTRGHTRLQVHLRPAKLFLPATARHGPATPRTAQAEREQHG